VGVMFAALAFGRFRVSAADVTPVLYSSAV